MTKAIRLLLSLILIATALSWCAHNGALGRLEAPWHPYVPWAFWSALLVLLFTEGTNLAS